MKRIIYLILLAAALILTGCATTDKSDNQVPQEEPQPVAVEETVVEESIIEEPVVEEISEPEQEFEPEPEPVEEVIEEQSEPEPQEEFSEFDDMLEEEPVVEEITDYGEEYERSINNMEGSVSIEDFVEDKRDILSRIKKLDDVMDRKDFLTWKTFVEPESLSYWSLKGNLKKVSAMLPIKGIQLNSLEDYFKFVFIQSRIGRQIDEIRYISDSYVKAVQVTDSQDVVYYYFIKLNGIWKLKLPPLND